MRRGTVVRAGLAGAAALAEPFAEVAWKCRSGFETSEACVWGKSLIVLHLGLSMVVVMPVAFVLLVLVEWAWRRVRSPAAA